MTAAKLLVGQSGGPTQVINASLAGLIEAGQRSGAFPEIWGLRHGIEGALGEPMVRLDQLGQGDLDRLARTPAAALGSCRHKLTPDDYGRIVDFFRRHEVRWFCYTGGNDSMDTCHQLARAAEDQRYALQVYGVPKTIDNDLVETDHCPGYGSAARYWAIATQEATLDLAAMRTYDRVLVLECMGRNAGWLAAATALYKMRDEDGPHLLLTPERHFDEEAFLAQVETMLGRVGYCVVAASETIRDASGEYVARARGGMDRFGHQVVTAVGETLAQLVGERLGVKARASKPGTLQRTSVAYTSVVDRDEAREAGRVAARSLAAGRSGEMVTLRRPGGADYRCEFGAAPLAAIANHERPMPPEFFEEGGECVSTAFRNYALPLLGPAPEPLFQLA